MKKVLLVLIFLISEINILYCQAPGKFNYQAVARNPGGTLIINQSISVRISILTSSTSGPSEYTETHSATTDAFGVFNLLIGNGTIINGSFDGITWGTASKFLMIEADVTGGTTYQPIASTQILSMPYALFANKAGSYTESDPVFGISPAFGITNSNISNWNSTFSWGNHSLAGYVPGTRTLNINGISLDLSNNRSWSVGTVTSVGLSLPNIFTLTGSPITSNGTFTATLASQPASLVFASPSGGPGTPAFRTLTASDIPNLDWNKITTGKPTTLAGYGISDGVNTTGNQTIAGNKTFTGITSVPTPVNATDAATKAYVDALLQKINQLESQPGIVKDVEGNLYTTIKIGTQVWIVENFRATKYNDGTTIPLVTNNTDWINLTTPGYCWYNNDQPTYGITYGALYNWYTVNTGKLCPTGWHVPTDAEWSSLETYLISNGYNYDGTTTGNKAAKSLASTSLWNSSSNVGSIGNIDYPDKRNATGFTAIPSGLRYETNGTFSGIGWHSDWWSAQSANGYRGLNYDTSDVYKSNANNNNGLSVRCLRD
jgi:uncharacterized protein (TIGR02145 family)